MCSLETFRKLPAHQVWGWHVTTVIYRRLVWCSGYPWGSRLAMCMHTTRAQLKMALKENTRVAKPVTGFWDDVQKLALQICKLPGKVDGTTRDNKSFMNYSMHLTWRVYILIFWMSKACRLSFHSYFFSEGEELVNESCKEYLLKIWIQTISFCRFLYLKKLSCTC